MAGESKRPGLTPAQAENLTLDQRARRLVRGDAQHIKRTLRAYSSPTLLAELRRAREIEAARQHYLWRPRLLIFIDQLIQQQQNL